jgi:hypothetical protein
MPKQISRGLPVCEGLESRTLLSGTLAAVKADVALLQTDSAAFKVAIHTLATDLKVVPAGTAGLKGLHKDDKTLKADLQQLGLGAKLNKIKGSKGTSKEATLADKFAQALAAIKTKVDAKVPATETAISAHPTLATDDTHLTADEDAVNTALNSLNNDISQTITDLDAL